MSEKKVKLGAPVIVFPVAEELRLFARDWKSAFRRARNRYELYRDLVRLDPELWGAVKIPSRLG